MDAVEKHKDRVPMRIQSSDVSLASAHSYTEKVSRKESLQVWVGSRQPAATEERETHGANPGAETGHTRHDHHHHDASESDDQQTEIGKAEEQLDPRDRMVKALMDRLFAAHIKLQAVPQSSTQCSGRDECTTPTPGANDAPTPSDAEQQGWGVDYQSLEVRSESEQTAFAAKGAVQTADGRQIEFNVALAMSRQSIQETKTSIKAGDALIDPLVLSFNGTAAQLTDQRVAFDLNSDGKDENIASLQSGAAFLALDKNGDGTINNGSELFGPSSGAGFGELEAYDVDHNSWIDENDPIFNKLSLMNFDGAGKQALSSLAQRSVGAIYLGNVSTPFSLKTDTQQTLGQIATTGVYLNEQGGVGLVQQVDLAV
jgi:hypothetical protein